MIESYDNTMEEMKEIVRCCSSNVCNGENNEEDEQEVKMKVENKIEIKIIECFRGDSSTKFSFGFSVFGGSDTSHPPTICHIESTNHLFRQQKSSLERLKEGDIILSINGIPTSNSTREEIIKKIRLSGSMCRLKVKSDERYSYDLKKTNLLKQQQQQLNESTSIVDDESSNLKKHHNIYDKSTTEQLNQQCHFQLNCQIPSISNDDDSLDTISLNDYCPNDKNENESNLPDDQNNNNNIYNSNSSCQSMENPVQSPIIDALKSINGNETIYDDYEMLLSSINSIKYDDNSNRESMELYKNFIFSGVPLLSSIGKFPDDNKNQNDDHEFSMPYMNKNNNHERNDSFKSESSSIKTLRPKSLRINSSLEHSESVQYFTDQLVKSNNFNGDTKAMFFNKQNSFTQLVAQRFISKILDDEMEVMENNEIKFLNCLRKVFRHFNFSNQINPTYISMNEIVDGRLFDMAKASTELESAQNRIIDFTTQYVGRYLEEGKYETNARHLFGCYLLSLNLELDRLRKKYLFDCMMEEYQIYLQQKKENSTMWNKKMIEEKIENILQNKSNELKENIQHNFQLPTFVQHMGTVPIITELISMREIRDSYESLVSERIEFMEISYDNDNVDDDNILSTSPLFDTRLNRNELNLKNKSINLFSSDGLVSIQLQRKCIATINEQPISKLRRQWKNFSVHLRRKEPHILFFLVNDNGEYPFFYKEIQTINDAINITSLRLLHSISSIIDLQFNGNKLNKFSNSLSSSYNHHHQQQQQQQPLLQSQLKCINGVTYRFRPINNQINNDQLIQWNYLNNLISSLVSPLPQLNYDTILQLFLMILTKNTNVQITNDSIDPNQLFNPIHLIDYFLNKCQSITVDGMNGSNDLSSLTSNDIELIKDFQQYRHQNYDYYFYENLTQFKYSPSVDIGDSGCSIHSDTQMSSNSSSFLNINHLTPDNISSFRTFTAEIMKKNNHLNNDLVRRLFSRITSIIDRQNKRFSSLIADIVQNETNVINNKNSVFPQNHLSTGHEVNESELINNLPAANIRLNSAMDKIDVNIFGCDNNCSMTHNLFTFPSAINNTQLIDETSDIQQLIQSLRIHLITSIRSHKQRLMRDFRFVKDLMDMIEHIRQIITVKLPQTSSTEKFFTKNFSPSSNRRQLDKQSTNNNRISYGSDNLQKTSIRLKSPFTKNISPYHLRIIKKKEKSVKNEDNHDHQNSTSLQDLPLQTVEDTSGINLNKPFKMNDVLIPELNNSMNFTQTKSEGKSRSFHTITEKSDPTFNVLVSNINLNGNSKSGSSHSILSGSSTGNVNKIVTRLQLKLQKLKQRNWKSLQIIPQTITLQENEESNGNKTETNEKDKDYLDIYDNILSLYYQYLYLIIHDTVLSSTKFTTNRTLNLLHKFFSITSSTDEKSNNKIRNLLIKRIQSPMSQLVLSKEFNFIEIISKSFNDEISRFNKYESILMEYIQYLEHVKKSSDGSLSVDGEHNIILDKILSLL
ncbi:hypothetical protein SNEBB_006644 [Seison nebaliae]|nr:hypothetical protein SNEBB_006644 [Seison nebaliae]